MSEDECFPLFVEIDGAENLEINTPFGFMTGTQYNKLVALHYGEYNEKYEEDLRNSLLDN